MLSQHALSAGWRWAFAPPAVSATKQHTIQCESMAAFSYTDLHMHSPGLWVLVSITVWVVLSIVRKRLRSGRRTGELSPVACITVTPVSVPLSWVRRRVGLVLLLLIVPQKAISVFVFVSVGVTARVVPGVTSVIHDDPLLPEVNSSVFTVNPCRFCFQLRHASQSTSTTATSFHEKLTAADNKSAW